MADGGTNIKYAFRQHLIDLGFVFDQPKDKIREQLIHHMGTERFAEFQRLTKSTSGEDGQNLAYDFMRNFREANLLRSIDLGVTLEASFYLYERALPLLCAGKRVIELACWTGGFSSFIAEHHPDCIVAGVDRARQILDLDRALYKLSNLSFVYWDYRKEKPAELECADILLCVLGTNNDRPQDAYRSFDACRVRGSKGYQCEKAELGRYFANWCHAAKPGAMLLTVLRVFTFPRFLACMDAAQQFHWTPATNEFANVGCPANNERIPYFVFVHGDSNRMTEDEALSYWIRLSAGTDELARYTGAAALGLYKAFGSKKILGKRNLCNQAGACSTEELGLCGPFGYIYVQDGAPNHKLVLLSRTKADQLGQLFRPQPKPSCTITTKASQSPNGQSQTNCQTGEGKQIPLREITANIPLVTD